MSNLIIRSYRPNDRDVVRKICSDAADRGELIENIFPDREVAADLLTGYYTDYEPASTFVAESDGQVVGYVQSCFDNRRYGLVMFWIMFPKTFIKAFKHGVFFNKKSLGFIGSMLGNWPRLFTWRKESFHSHQGHMHIGIARDFRGRRIGRQLIASLLQYAHEQGVHELTASVHDGNAAARRFFEQLGFQPREEYPMSMASPRGLEKYHSIFYVRTID